jgi:hypothetical protein
VPIGRGCRHLLWQTLYGLHRLCWLPLWLLCRLPHFFYGEGHEHLTNAYHVSPFDLDLRHRACTGRRDLDDGLIGLDL